MPTKAGPYSKNDVKTTRGDTGDKPFGSRRQLDVDKNYRQGAHEAWTWPPSKGTPNQLPKDGK